MDQTLLVHFLLCYVMIAAIVARPLPSDKEKRQSSMRQMEDVQFSESELRRNGEESPSDQGGVRFYSSSGIINTWTGGEIPYIFDRQFLTEHKKKAKKAMDEWSEHTCIKFRRMKSSELRTTDIMDFVRIQYANVTNSRVGRKDRDWNVRGQELNIRKSQADIPRIYLHEFGHVIGLHHEHSRKDRDRYVKVYSENIIPGVGHNFDKINYYKKNTPYDYYSIMHYRIYEYAIDKNKFTIEILNPDNIKINNDSVGDRRKLSDDDISWVNELYKCPTTPPPPVTPEPPKFYRQFKVKLARVPAVVPKSGYIFTAKEYLKCNNESCHVQVNEEPEFFITKLGNSTGRLQIGDKVLLSSHKSSVRQGEWILCDFLNCYSSRSCLNSSHNSSSGEVNFAFNRPACKDHVLTISSKFQKNGTIENHSRIILEYRDNPRSQEEWMQCDAGGTCSRKECMRTNVTILGLEIECKNQMDEFEAIFVS